jgi:hypothetical protein
MAKTTFLSPFQVRYLIETLERFKVHEYLAKIILKLENGLVLAS